MTGTVNGSKNLPYAYVRVPGPGGKPIQDHCVRCPTGVSLSVPAIGTQAGVTAAAATGTRPDGADARQRITLRNGQTVHNTGVGNSVEMVPPKPKPPVARPIERGRVMLVGRAVDPGVPTLVGRCRVGPCRNTGQDGPKHLTIDKGPSTVAVGDSGIKADCPGDCKGTGANKVAPAEVTLRGASAVLTDTELTTAGAGRQESRLGARNALAKGGTTRIDGTQAQADCGPGCTEHRVFNAATGLGARGTGNGGPDSDGHSIVGYSDAVRGEVASAEQNCKGAPNCRAEAFAPHGPSGHARNAKGGCVGGVCEVRAAVGPDQAELRQKSVDAKSFDRSVTWDGLTVTGGGRDNDTASGVSSIGPGGAVLSYQEAEGGVVQSPRPVINKQGQLVTETINDPEAFGMGATVGPDGAFQWRTPRELLTSVEQKGPEVIRGLSQTADVVNNHDVVGAALPLYVTPNGAAVPPPTSARAAAEAMGMDHRIAAGVETVLTNREREDPQ